MPELPEVETICRSLAPRLLGRIIDHLEVRDARLRRPVCTQALIRDVVGRKICAVTRRAKYILVHFEGGRVLALHLGMSGRLRLKNAAVALEKHDHIIFKLDDKSHLRLNDSRRFGLAVSLSKSDLPTHSLFQHLGVEPLEAAHFTPTYFRNVVCRGESAIKVAIMNAQKVVGVGNIYACEALFRSEVSPHKPAGRLTTREREMLHAAIVVVLHEAIEQGGTTLRDFEDALGNAGLFVQKLHVYGREGQPCPRCYGPIRREVQAARSTFYCPQCQRPRKSRARTSAQVVPAGTRTSVATE